MRIFSFPNLSQAYTTHRYRKDERGTVIKVIGLDEAGSAVVGEVQAAGGGMIDEFVHVRARAPEPNATRFTVFDSLREAAQGAHLLILVARPALPFEVESKRRMMAELLSADRLVIEILLSGQSAVPPTLRASGKGAPAQPAPARHCTITLPTPTQEYPSTHSMAESAGLALRCIRTLTDLLDSYMVGIDFDDLKVALMDARVCRFAWGRHDGEQKGRMATYSALAELLPDGSFSAKAVTGLVVLIEGERQSLKMRDLKVVIDTLLPALHRDTRIACNMVFREDMPADTLDVNVIVALAE